jgi:hypothetical protein
MGSEGLGLEGSLNKTGYDNSCNVLVTMFFGRCSDMFPTEFKVKLIKFMVSAQ